MKVKLLKKIRKRYSITHYPNGTYMYGEFVEGPVTILRDSSSTCRYDFSSKEKIQAYRNLHDTLLKWIEQDYGPFRSKKSKIRAIICTLW